MNPLNPLMRALPVTKAMGYLVPSLIYTGLFVSSTLVAMPSQGALTTTAKPAKETALSTKNTTGSLTKNPVLARNTTAKPEPSVINTAPPTEKKTQDKKTLGRCWKRLMNMVREVNYAHHTKTTN